MSLAPRPRMRTADLFGLALSALGQQKVRTALTVVGVAIGSFALIVSLSIGRGVDRAILSLFQGTDALRQVGVFVNYERLPMDVPEEEKRVEGDMSDAKRARIRSALIRSARRTIVDRPRARLDAEGLARLAALPHVERVIPEVQLSVDVRIDEAGVAEDVWFAAADPLSDYRHRLIAGREPATDGAREAIVHEFLLYKLGLRHDDEVRRVLGKSIRLEYRISRGNGFSLARLLTLGEDGFTPDQSEALIRALRRLAPLLTLPPFPAKEREAFRKLLAKTPIESPKMREESYAETFTITGVVRESLAEDETRTNMFGGWVARTADVMLPPKTAAAFYLRAPTFARSGLSRVVLTADRDENVKEVARTVEALGYTQNSLIQVLETIRLNVVLISFATAFIALVALAVAAIGITNTMFMSVLERTHEIGIMKALGAKTGQVRAIFLVEGALIGSLGGAIGLLLAYLASFPGDSVAKSIMERQTPRPVEGSVFAFPLWLVIGAPVLAVLISTLAAVYPAHRAARVDPITSLRHE